MYNMHQTAKDAGLHPAKRAFGVRGRGRLAAYKQAVSSQPQAATHSGRLRGT